MHAHRHVYGEAAKKEGCYDNVKVTNNVSLSEQDKVVYELF